MKHYLKVNLIQTGSSEKTLISLLLKPFAGPKKSKLSVGSPEIKQQQ